MSADLRQLCRIKRVKIIVVFLLCFIFSPDQCNGISVSNVFFSAFQLLFLPSFFNTGVRSVIISKVFCPHSLVNATLTSPFFVRAFPGNRLCLHTWQQNCAVWLLPPACTCTVLAPHYKPRCHHSFVRFSFEIYYLPVASWD